MAPSRHMDEAQDKSVEVVRYRMRRLTQRVDGKEVPTDRYDVVEEVVRGRVVKTKKHESSVSLPVARERWDRLKREQSESQQGRI